MDIFDTTLGDEITRVINNAKGSGIFIDAVVHAGEHDIEVLKVLNMDNFEDYINNYTGETKISLLISSGKVAHKVIPYKDQLEISLKLSTANIITGSYDGETPINVERFRAVLVESEDTAAQSQGREIKDEFTMDIGDLEVVEFQLFSKAVEQLMLRSCGGSYRKTAKPDLIKALLLQETQNIDVDQEYMPKGVDMVEPPDTAPREHIVIPHGTPVTDAPGYIHKHCGGVYPAGLSYFYKNDFWYVFPTYDYTRYQEADKNLVILQVPPNKIPDIEFTYLKESSVLTILTTGDSLMQDQSEAQALTEGNGTRYSDAGSLFQNTATIKDNKVVVSRNSNNNEFVSAQRKAGFNNVTTSSNRITSNSMYEASKLAARKGSRIQVVWENSEPSLIVPGMQAKFLYFKEGQVKELKCVVVGIESSMIWTGKGIVQGRHDRQTAISLFAENLVKND